MYLYQRSDSIIVAANSNFKPKHMLEYFTNEDSRYFLYNLLYYKHNINIFLPEHYANIADVLQVKIQLNLIKNRQNNYILNI